MKLIFPEFSSWFTLLTPVFGVGVRNREGIGRNEHLLVPSTSSIKGKNSMTLVKA